MSTLKKLRIIFDRKQKIKIFVLSIMIVIGAILELVGVTAILPFVNVAMSPDLIFSNKNLNSMYQILNSKSVNEFLAFLALSLVIIYIIKNAYLVFMNYCIFRFTYNNQRNMAYRLLKSYLMQPYTFFVYHNSADLMRNINSDTLMMFDTVLSLMQLAVECIVCVVLFVFLLVSDKSITIGISIILIVFLVFFVRSFRVNLKNRGQKERECNGKMNQWLLQTFGGIKATKIMEKESFFLKKYYRIYTEFANNHCIYQTLSYIPKPLMETLCIGGVLAVVALKLLRGVGPEYFISTVSVFAIAAMRLLPAFNRITGYASRVMFNKSGVDAIYNDLLQVKKLEQIYSKNIDRESKKTLCFEKNICMRNIIYRYPNTDLDILKDINLTIKKNTSVAIIGQSGAGKTTLVDVLLGVLEPQKGEIYVDDVNIKGNMGAWHEKIGYIPQTIYLLDDTIEKNIAYALDDDKIDHNKVERAIKEAQLKEFIDSLPAGLNTVIGEGGIRLSGGQKQRIGIARALYSNPDVLVLDEATSALDSETENAVMEAINMLSGKKTLIIIAHRLTTLKNCDYVYEVKDGRVIQTTIPS